jgi:hypothetical protein
MCKCHGRNKINKKNKKKNKKKKKNCQFEPEFTIVNEIITRVPEWDFSFLVFNVLPPPWCLPFWPYLIYFVPFFFF